MNVAAPASADHLDGHELNPVSGLDKGQQHLGLDLEMVCLQAQRGPSLQVDQPKPALRVRQKPAGDL